MAPLLSSHSIKWLGLLGDCVHSGQDSTNRLVNWLMERWHKNWFWNTGNKRVNSKAGMILGFQFEENTGTLGKPTTSLFQICGHMFKAQARQLGIFMPRELQGLLVVGRAKRWHGALDGGFELLVSQKEILEKFINFMDSALRKTKIPDQAKQTCYLAPGSKDSTEHVQYQLLGRWKELQTHVLLLANCTNENDFDSNSITLVAKDDAGPPWARNHFNIMNKHYWHCRTKIQDVWDMLVWGALAKETWILCNTCIATALNAMPGRHMLLETC